MLSRNNFTGGQCVITLTISLLRHEVAGPLSRGPPTTRLHPQNKLATLAALALQSKKPKVWT